MDKVLEQLGVMRQEQQRLRELKEAEAREQGKFIANFKTLLAVFAQKKEDYVVDNLIQINESVGQIATDVLGFKSIRHKLFVKASQDKDPANRLYLYMFHLFESLVCSVSALVQKSANQLFQQFP